MSEHAQVPVWRTADGKEIPMTDMSEEHLQAAYNYSEQRMMDYHNKTLIFGDLMDKLEEAAVSRGIKLQSVDELKPNIGDLLSKRRHAKQLKSIEKKLS